MSRYENSKLKQKYTLRGKSKPKNYNIKSYNTTTYSFIPEENTDLWVITQMGDRLDNLAYQYYGDTSLWLYIAKAKGLYFMTVPTGTSLRIPGTIKYAIGR